MIPAFLVGLGLGAALMYIADPDRGNRRRALVRDQAIHYGKQAQNLADEANRQGRYIGGKLRGTLAESQARLREERVPNDVLVERVRSAMGRAVSHPRAIQVVAREGHLVLSGPVLERDVEQLIDTAEHVRGVRSVENRLEVHREPGRIPSLQEG